MFYLKGRHGPLRVALGAIACVLLAHGAPASAQTLTISLSLAKYDVVKHSPAGDFVGVSPGVLHVHVGDAIIFNNEDVKAHTVVALPDSGAFPDDPHWTDDVLRQTGYIGDAMWSTGELKPGASSKPIQVKKAGKYLYGCFIDYSAGMRGEIVVDP
ncbi:MAG TPA: hypothetical protein VII69_02955 [Candidatus Eremiobacteraceae bacterium]